MKLYYKPQVVKQLKKFPKSEKRKLVNKLEKLKEDPNTGKKLKGELEGLRSLRVWPYRVTYELKGNKIIIYSIA